MMPQKRITVAACGLFIMLGFIAGGIAKLDRETKLTDETLSEATASVENFEEEIPQTNYVVKIEDGVVVVYKDNDLSRPIIVTDIYASTLRHRDREELNAGIAVNGDFELYSLIEDFSV